MKLIYMLDLNIEHSVTVKTLIGNKTLDGPVMKKLETVSHVILLDEGHDLYHGNRSDVNDMTRFYNRTNQPGPTRLSSAAAFDTTYTHVWRLTVGGNELFKPLIS